MLLPICVNKKESGGAFSPTDISNLEAWYDMSDTSTITHTSNSVSQVDDKSGNANHATQGVAVDQPTTNTRTINSLNTVFGDGVSDHLITPIYPNGNNVTVFCVFKSLPSFSGTNSMYGSHDNSNQRQYLAFNGSGNLVMGTGNSIMTGSTAFSTDTVYTTMTRKSGANAVSLHVDGNVEISNDPHSFSGTSSDLIMLMARTFNGSVLEEYENDFCEWLFYRRSLTDTEANQVGNYLADKWGHTYTDIT